MSKLIKKGIFLALTRLAVFTALSIQPAWAGGKITVAAASDLTFALTELAGAFERSTGTRVVISFGSTGNLAAQIENGAPFDVFFAANFRHIDGLDSKGLIEPGTKELYARGRIVLAVNSNSGLKVRSLEDLSDPSVGRIAVANPDHASYGMAAREALTKLGLWEKVRSRLVYGENIRQALKYVQTGDAPAGIIALSVAGVPGVSHTLIDERLHSPIDQAVAVIKASGNKETAKAFVRFVKGPEGRAVMKRYGFMLPGEF